MNENVAIEIEKVTKFFNDEKTPALENISAKIQNGRITGLVGPDASGKTTLIRLITGLIVPTKGSIRVCGHDTTSTGNDLFNYLSYMPQKFGLYEDLTVIENLELYARLRGVFGEERAKTFKKMLDFTDLNEFKHRL